MSDEGAPGLPSEEDGWPLAGDPRVHVGSRHHLVPRFYLERFAHEQRVAAVNPRTGEQRVTHIKDTGTEKDFYTIVNADGELDGRMEHLLGRIEDNAADAIRNMTSIFGGDVSPGDRISVCLLLAFQMNRGRTARRRGELIADMTTRLFLDGIRDEQAARDYVERQGATTTPETIAAVIETSNRLDEYEFVSDPNEHITVIGQLAEQAMPYLVGRRWYIFEYRERVLFTGDEPVSLFSPGPHDEHESLGLANAEQIYFPLDPHCLLMLGPPERGIGPVVRRPGHRRGRNWRIG